jgi:signal transduction histidine kinase
VTAVVDELLASIALGAGDRSRLVALHPVLAPQFPAIADAFDVAARANPATAAILAAPDRAARARATLIDWMSTGLLGPYDDAFGAARSRIGQRHVELGLDPRYLVAAVGVARRAYRDRIAAAYPAAEAHAAGTAVDKLLDFELALMVRYDAQATRLAGERERRLEQVEAMQTLCAGLAHEVRNPLNAARLQLALAERRLRRSGDDPKLVEPIELAAHEIDRLTGLLDEFLAFARPPALDPRSQDVAAVVGEAVACARPLAERRGARLTLAETSAPLVAEIDAAKLREIVDHLVRNAIEAVTAGGHVAVAVERSDDHVHIRVTDDGAGIPAGVLPRIYEPFFSTKEGGTGLGMSIAHSLVALHRGTIAVASSPAGTTFEVALPCRAPGAER